MQNTENQGEYQPLTYIQYNIIRQVLNAACQVVLHGFQLVMMFPTAHYNSASQSIIHQGNKHVRIVTIPGYPICTKP